MSFDQRIFRDPETGFVLDLSRSPVHKPECWDEPIKQMCALEAGGIANQDEDRMVGHYWLRAPERAPSSKLQSLIETSWTALNQLDLGEHTDVVLIGIGGSALGPQFLRDALHSPQDSAQLHFIDNTDPEGFHRTLQDLDPHRTLSVVVSKSGGTVETRNAMLAATQWYRAAGTSIGEHAVAITGPSSLLADHASG